MQPLTENTVNVPAFLSKLWKMVNDPGTDHLICWSPGGKSFYIQNQAQFWYELLPLYYKHNNMSSFVRQLNMYGFHKMSTYENGTIDADKDEIQFYHPFFQKDQPELLKLIKRKVTGSKHSENINSAPKSDDLLKVLDDVKQLRGRQASVDSQLSAMKNENAVLWRELAMLRQKHLKQQQIVNKLIQFLVTCVHPRRGGLGVKRCYPLMLNESPQQKKAKSNLPVNSEGPTIHELESTDILSDELFTEETESLGQPENSTLNTDPEKVQSPSTPHSTSTKGSQQGDENPPTPSTTLLEEPAADNINSDLFWDSPDFVYIKPEQFLSPSDIQEDGSSSAAEAQPNNIDNLTNDKLDTDAQRIFLNPTAQDTMLSDLLNGSYNTSALNGSKASGNSTKKDQEKEQPALSPNNTDNSNMAVATRDPMLTINRLNSVEDFDQHVENTQTELEQLKDILNGYNSFDANALLGLFSDDAPDYGLSYNQVAQNNTMENTDPLVSGSELTTYEPGNSLIDFSELFDDSVDIQDSAPPVTSESKDESINTPQVVQMNQPVFPTDVSVSKKL